MLEQRHEARSSMIRAARIVFGGASQDCALLDLSASGARVILRAVADLPETLILWVPDGKAHMVRRRWQRDTQAGLSFVVVAPRWSDALAGEPARQVAPYRRPRR